MTTPAPVTGATSNPTPVVAKAGLAQSVLGQVASNPYGIGSSAGGNGGDLYSPINQGQQAQLYEQPQTVAGVSNTIGQNIQGALNLSNQTAPTAGLTSLANAPGINTATSNAITAAQLQQANNLNNTAQGLGPSVAATQAAQTGQQNIANQMAMIASQRGGSANTALGLRSAQNAAAQAAQQNVQAATLGEANEALTAQGQLTAALGTAQGQVQQGAQAQAGLQSSANLANSGALNQNNLAQLQANLTTQGLNTQQYNAGLTAQMDQANAALGANENYAQLTQNAASQAAATGAGLEEADTANQIATQNAFIGGAATVGAGALQALSDKRMKTNITSGTRSIKDFMSKLPSKPSAFNLMSA